MNESDTVLLVRIDERTRQIVEAQERAFATLGRHERRISSLERWRAWIVGALAALGLVVAVALRLFQ